MTKCELQDRYWKYLLTKGERPKSVFAFMEHLELEEATFYESVPGFDALENGYWLSTVTDTIEVLENDDDYADYPADQKLLAFFYTYITHIQKHRSRFVQYFPKMSGLTSNALKQMKESFSNFANGIVQEGVQQGIFADRKQLLEYYDRFIWAHFLAIIHYYIKDQSESFQDTDAFIEKSVNLGVQSAAHGVLESGFDFVRFMVAKDDRFKGLSKILSKFIPE